MIIASGSPPTPETSRHRPTQGVRQAPSPGRSADENDVDAACWSALHRTAICRFPNLNPPHCRLRRGTGKGPGDGPGSCGG
jgi:hypothetical protein